MQELTLIGHQNMKIKPWKVWGALATAGVAIAVNLATEWKYNLLTWAVVLGLVVLAVWFDSKADQGEQHSEPSRHRGQQIPLVLRCEERNGDARRSVSTTSEKVATEFLKRVPPPLDPPHDPRHPEL
ncbi:hypothetical protein [Actinomadura rugatobispora]|uniref:Uncharacterized protein n=1 Tax=Actinomadura rugatobispora TaxID=1994 RepID=A0ABW1AK56_9ACTN|nr:hypothetical protein GCM10010200_046470 [Actinomadura rugatobispora]